MIKIWSDIKIIDVTDDIYIEVNWSTATGGNTVAFLLHYSKVGMDTPILDYFRLFITEFYSYFF